MQCRYLRSTVPTQKNKIYSTGTDSITLGMVKRQPGTTGGEGNSHLIVFTTQPDTLPKNLTRGDFFGCVKT